MKQFFYADLQGVTQSIVDGVCTENNLSVDDNFKELLVSFYTEALAGMLIDYFKYEQRYDRNDLIRHIIFILKKSIPNILTAKYNESSKE